jgi:hypothetical protein
MDELTKTDRHHLLSECKKTLVGCDETLGRVAWDWGNALKQVQELELWRDDGATSFSAWLEKEVAISRTSALRAIGLCVHFTSEMAGRYGGRKLTAALIYLELTGKIEKPGDLQGIDIRIRGPKGTFITVPFSKASGPQIEDANAILREAEAARIAKQKAKEIDQSTHDNAAALAALLPPAPPKSFRGKKRVIPVKASDGTVAYTIHGVPETTMKAFQAWLKANPPQDE